MAESIFRYRKRPCVALKQDIVVGTYSSVKEAAAVLCLSAKRISDVLNGKKKSYHEYTFRDAEPVADPVPVRVTLPIRTRKGKIIGNRYFKGRSHSREAIAVDAWKDGSIIGSYKSMSVAATTLNVRVCEISAVVRGAKENAKGYVFTRHADTAEDIHNKEEIAMEHDSHEQTNKNEEVVPSMEWPAKETEPVGLIESRELGNRIISLMFKAWWIPGTWEPPLIEHSLFIRVEYVRDGKVILMEDITSSEPVACNDLIFEIFNRIAY